MPDLAEIARRAGVTEPQARAVLDAAAAVEREPTPMSDFATWAAGVVVVASVGVYIAFEDGFEVDPHGKGAVLAVTLVVAAGAVAAARAARARGYRLGEQMGFTIAAALVPVIAWTLLWVAGVWPGHVVHQPDYSYWDSDGHDREKAALLAWGVWLGCLQALIGTVVATIDPDIDLPTASTRCSPPSISRCSPRWRCSSSARSATAPAGRGRGPGWPAASRSCPRSPNTRRTASPGRSGWRSWSPRRWAAAR